MNREIKYRCWDKITGKIWPVSEIHFIAENGVSVHMKGRPYEGDKFLTLVTYERLMQYTGLKDHSGKEIYEGDILASEDGDGQYVDGIVKWHDLGFTLCDKDGYVTDSDATHDADNWKDLDIIGNIFETPKIADCVV